jgi:exopolyphosphatase/guanosine-5'-triphosphate,3'-diphosphate pyrophosphatase
MRVGVLDFGTNSTRMLVADVRDERLEELARGTEVTRLGEGVDASGRIGAPAIERVLSAVAGYRATMDELGVERVIAVATSAMRDAENSEDLTAPLAERFGVEARTISGEREALLTFLGATAGRPEAPDGLTMVFDIGGGSTEYVVGHAGRRPDFFTSTRMGSVRQTERHGADLEAIRADVREVIEEQVPVHVRAKVGGSIAVAGTATSLAAVAQELEPYEPARVEGYVLLLEEAEEILARMAGMSLPERERLPGLLAARAPTIVAGAAILVETVRVFELPSVTVSERDILHGAALSTSAG